MSWKGKKMQSNEETRHFKAFVTPHYQKGVVIPYSKHIYTITGQLQEKREGHKEHREGKVIQRIF